ncbi:AVN_HP_G0120160.mRNA.1.CDS.1 [Saccharomyces cerevisiae]|nr:AVN_HP_G0120160.mRNA.1.CDS.1 [Saccharomyces cerevisiae]CAI6997240.1 AVN_HP_G0120160.mRNA.1.CDS.1 [Saccharomyces cerevisiae]
MTTYLSPSHDNNNPHSFARPMPAYHWDFQKKVLRVENIRDTFLGHIQLVQDQAVNTVDDRSTKQIVRSEIDIM